MQNLADTTKFIIHEKYGRISCQGRLNLGSSQLTASFIQQFEVSTEPLLAAEVVQLWDLVIMTARRHGVIML